MRFANVTKRNFGELRRKRHIRFSVTRNMEKPRTAGIVIITRSWADAMGHGNRRGPFEVFFRLYFLKYKAFSGVVYK